MTAPAAAPASAPVAPPPPRAAPQPPADAHAFAAVLDALPGGAMKASASTAAEEPHPSGEKRLDQPPGQRPGHSPPGDGLLLASLPLAVQAASRIDGSPACRGPCAFAWPPGGETAGIRDRRRIRRRKRKDGGSRAADRPTRLSLRRLHERDDPPRARFGVWARRRSPAPLSRSRSDLGGGLPQVEVLPAAALANAVPPGAGAPASAAVRAGPRRSSRASGAAMRPREANARPKPRRQPRPPRCGSAPAAPPAEPDGDGKAPGGRSPDPVAPLAPSLAQAGPFGAPLAAASFGAAASFAPDGSAAGAGEVAPRANAQGPGAASTAPPVREIDVDLSPGGLEDVSMTMRLAGDRLSVVVRAAKLSDPEFNRRRARRDRRSPGGDRATARLAHHPADGRQSGWNHERKRGFRRRRRRRGTNGGRRAAQARDPVRTMRIVNRRGAHRDRGF